MRDPIRRYVIVHEGSNRIVAETAGNHKILPLLIERLEQRVGGAYFYDDASAAGDYLPMFGSGVALSVR